MRAMLLVYGSAAAGSSSAPLDSDAEASAALEQDPGNPDAAAVRLFWRFGGLVPVPEAEAAAREAIRAHPSDWRSWALLGASLDPSARATERLEARMRAAQLAPENPAVLNSLAWDDVMAGRPQDALAVAERALRLSPADANIVDTYAAALAGVGECAAALRWQRRAVDLVQEGTSPTFAGSYSKRLREYETRCGRSGGGGAAATAR
jgi:Flp pilus assembly protein TadD